MSVFFQKSLRLPSYPQGYHLITDQIEKKIPEIQDIRIGFLQVFLQHTSAGLCINENADPTVRKDFQTFISELIPETYPRFVHDYEGTDDMPAHIKSAFFLVSVFKYRFPVENSPWEFGREFTSVSFVITEAIET